MEVILAWTVVIGTSIWMGFDSAQRRISTGDHAYSVGSSVGWFLFGLLLWIVAFPVYLFKRSKAQAGPAMPQAAPGGLAAQLSDLNALHKAGGLTDGDLERAKSKLLS